jgi:hypothetical protein
MVYISFLLILLGGIATFFCWPRIPLVAIGSHAQRHSTMTMDKLQLQTTWLMNMTLDNRENWIPTRLARMELTMVDSVTMASFASAVVTDLVLAPGGSAVVPNIVVNVSYMARVETDATWQALTKACVTKQGVDRSSLNMKMKVKGTMRLVAGPLMHFYTVGCIPFLGDSLACYCECVSPVWWVCLSLVNE